MVYVIGTKNEVEEYIAMVDDAENYQGTTTTWGTPIKHKDEDLWAVLKNDKYESPLQTVDTLDGWFPSEDE